MKTSSKDYIGTTIAIGALVILSTLENWRCENWPAFLVYACVGLMAAAMKVQLPGLRGNVSANFVFVLIGIAEFSSAETMLLGCAAAVMQSLWKARKRPSITQVAFNVAALAISIGAASSLKRQHLQLASPEQLVLMVGLATIILFLTNTSLVGGVLSRIQEKPFMEVWKGCFMWSFPCYVIGGFLAVLIAAASRTLGPCSSLIALPFLYSAFLYYRLIVQRFGRISIPATT